MQNMAWLKSNWNELKTPGKPGTVTTTQKPGKPGTVTPNFHTTKEIKTMFKKPVKLVRKNRKTGAIIGQISLNDFLKVTNEITPKKKGK